MNMNIKKRCSIPCNGCADFNLKMIEIPVLVTKTSTLYAQLCQKCLEKSLSLLKEHDQKEKDIPYLENE